MLYLALLYTQGTGSLHRRLLNMSSGAGKNPVIIIIMPSSSDTQVPSSAGNPSLLFPSLDSAIDNAQYLSYFDSGAQPHAIANYTFQPNHALTPDLGLTQAPAGTYNSPHPSHSTLSPGCWTTPRETRTSNSSSSFMPTPTSLEPAGEGGVGQEILLGR